MNERILELALQSGMKEILSEHASEYGNGMFENTPYPELEKFTQLVVQECISIVENLPTGYKDYRDQIEDAFRRDCITELKAHFGVEE